MFAPRYFANEYFAPHYWAGGAAAVVAIVPGLEYTCLGKLNYVTAGKLQFTVNTGYLRWTIPEEDR